ncbi:MAG: peptide chain release factor N(5)-glutamine methyltransferase [Bacteroidales bacterium]|jgi:release factor glutamine methyltransferase|nr:peptide chain release factor N(5)-glutamine methyltransferase [Bacteroidales bacterium]
MTIQDVKIEFQTRLDKIYPKKEQESFRALFFEHIGLSQTDCILYPQQKVSEQQAQLCSKVINRLEKHEPIQYILGYAYFYDLSFEVNPSVLIPRQETELMVHTIIQNHSQNTETILDLCTGSGCIAISLAHNLTKAHVHAVDISSEALVCAQNNAIKHTTSVHFSQQNILAEHTYKTLPECSIIVSNPPYVRQSEKQYMNANVLNYEPDLALFVSDSQPLLFYDAIADIGNSRLTQHGHLYCEINEAFGKEVAEIFSRKGYKEVHLIRDLHEKNRFVHAIKQ